MNNILLQIKEALKYTGEYGFAPLDWSPEKIFTWLQYLIDEIEQLKWKLARPVICQGICTSQADDYCGMHMSNESCIACNAIWTNAHVENKQWELEKAQLRQDPYWFLEACKASEELKKAQMEIDKAVKEIRTQIKRNDRYRQKNNLLLAENTTMREALAWYADQKNWKLGVNITMGSAFPRHEAIKSDKGEKARTALSSLSPKVEEGSE